PCPYTTLFRSRPCRRHRPLRGLDRRALVGAAEPGLRLLGAGPVQQRLVPVRAPAARRQAGRAGRKRTLISASYACEFQVLHQLAGRGSLLPSGFGRSHATTDCPPAAPDLRRPPASFSLPRCGLRLGGAPPACAIRRVPPSPSPSVV